MQFINLSIKFNGQKHLHQEFAERVQGIHFHSSFDLSRAGNPTNSTWRCKTWGIYESNGGFSTLSLPKGMYMYIYVFILYNILNIPRTRQQNLSMFREIKNTLEGPTLGRGFLDETEVFWILDGSSKL